ncbi:hypothetical protein BMR11_15820 [Methylococcaceae bacterium CS5]|nr:hypothetical protein BMR11_15820 [Methylococcaceae bacterium CS5]
MLCIFSTQKDASRKRPTLQLTGTKNLHFAKAPFPVFSARASLKGSLKHAFREQKTANANALLATAENQGNGAQRSDDF